MKGALLICGTNSDAGKSVVTAGICRWLKRQGVRVAPFKAQNMALNSVVTADGSEIGRAQAMQAAAAGVEPEAAMNPVLIKPSGERNSEVMLMGRPLTYTDAKSYQSLKGELRPAVADALADLRERFDVVICEGAGSPAEINLRAGDLANMGLAVAGDLPVLVVADIDRGGVFGSLLGTLALMDDRDQSHIAGFLVNKFRGDQSILQPGLDQLEHLTGRPCAGVLPYDEGLWMDAEDSLAIRSQPIEQAADDVLDVAVVRLRWISNFTDVDALIGEPGVRVRFTRSPADIARADLVVIPGTKATVEDLNRLKKDGIAQALIARAAQGDPILGVCGGYQMLGRTIHDEVESQSGFVKGLGLLPISTRFDEEKLLCVREGHCSWLQTDATGYEIRRGRITKLGGRSLIRCDGIKEGCRVDNVIGTSWHGLLEGDAFRRSLLSWVADKRGRSFQPGSTPFAELRERQLDRLGDMIEQHCDTALLDRLIRFGAPGDLPTLRLEKCA